MTFTCLRPFSGANSALMHAPTSLQHLHALSDGLLTSGDWLCNFNPWLLLKRAVASVGLPGVEQKALLTDQFPDLHPR